MERTQELHPTFILSGRDAKCACTFVTSAPEIVCGEFQDAWEKQFGSTTSWLFVGTSGYYKGVYNIALGVVCLG